MHCQGVTLRFQARGPKRSFDESEWSKQDVWSLYILFRAPNLKDLGAHGKIWGHMPLGMLNPVCRHVKYFSFNSRSNIPLLNMSFLFSFSST